jgi:hypothetical protein
MAMGGGRRTILTLPVFGFFGSLLAPVDLEFVDGSERRWVATPAPLQRSPMEPRFRPYFKPSSKLRMGSYVPPPAGGRTAHQPVISAATRHELVGAAWFRPNFHKFLTVHDRRVTDVAGLISILTQGLI